MCIKGEPRHELYCKLCTSQVEDIHLAEDIFLHFTEPPIPRYGCARDSETASSRSPQQSLRQRFHRRGTGHQEGDTDSYPSHWDPHGPEALP